METTEITNSETQATGNYELEHRLRFTNMEIEFILLLFEDMLEDIRLTKSMSADSKRTHNQDHLGPSYQKADSVHSEMTKKEYAVKDLIHRFESTLNNGKPRTSKYAQRAMCILLSKAKHNQEQNSMKV